MRRRRVGRGGTDEPGDRPLARHRARNRSGASRARVPEARRTHAHRGCIARALNTPLSRAEVVVQIGAKTYDRRNPPTVAKATSGPPSAYASGISVSTREAITAPPANARGIEIVSSPASPKAT